MVIAQLPRLFMPFSSASVLGVFQYEVMWGVQQEYNSWNCCVICLSHYSGECLIFMKCDHSIGQKWNAKTSKRPIKIIELNCTEHIFHLQCVLEKKRGIY